MFRVCVHIIPSKSLWIRQNTNVTKNLSVGTKDSYPATTVSYVVIHNAERGTEPLGQNLKRGEVAVGQPLFVDDVEQGHANPRVAKPQNYYIIFCFHKCHKLGAASGAITFGPGLLLYTRGSININKRFPRNREL